MNRTSTVAHLVTRARAINLQSHHVLSFRKKSPSRVLVLPVEGLRRRRRSKSFVLFVLFVAWKGREADSISTYERGVSFNTFDNPDAADFSLTLNYKHKGYQCTRRSRTFLCGIDQNDYSDFALEWLIDELVDDGDEIVCLRAVEKDSTIANDTGIETGRYRKEAEKLFKQVIHKNSQDEKAVSLVLELAVGKIQDIIQRMVCPPLPIRLVIRRISNSFMLVDSNL